METLTLDVQVVQPNWRTSCRKERSLHVSVRREQYEENVLTAIEMEAVMNSQVIITWAL